MTAPVVTAVAAGSPAERSGICVGDELKSIDDVVPQDVIEYHQLTDGADPVLVVRRPGEDLDRRFVLHKDVGEPVGLEVSSAVFDRIRTCDNHCSFCFIYQLPKGLRKSLYLKDDDYRLSFLYGNFTTLTRFTELDAERVLTERLSPLYVSIHATDPMVRARLLRNPRGATSLRWLKVLLAGGIEVHGQVVVCPGVNDGAVLEDTLLTLLDEYPNLASIGVVPLGISDHSNEPEMRDHTAAEAAAVIKLVAAHQRRCMQVLGRKVVFASDEYYLIAGAPLPSLRSYDGVPQHENGVGMIRTFERELLSTTTTSTGIRSGFFQSVDGAPAEGYRAPRTLDRASMAEDPADGPVSILTGGYGAQVLPAPLEAFGRPETYIVEVENRFFGGNIKVAGLMVTDDLRRAIATIPEDHRILLPDVCLTQDRFLDGGTIADLGRSVEIVATTGTALRLALGGRPSRQRKVA